MITQNTYGLECSDSRDRILNNALLCGLKEPSTDGIKAFVLLAAKLYKALRVSETILIFGWREWLIASKFLEFNEDLHWYMLGPYPCVCNEYQ